MLSLFTKKSLPKAELTNQLLNMSVHSWIKNDNNLKRLFEYFFKTIDKKYIEFIVQHNIQFISTNEKFSYSIDAFSGTKAIIILPMLKKLMLSPLKLQALAVITHELGHLYLNHGKSDKKILQKQIEADLFAANLGFAQELQDFLLDNDSSIDTKVRVSKLTSFVYKNFN